MILFRIYLFCVTNREMKMRLLLLLRKCLHFEDFCKTIIIAETIHPMRICNYL